MTGRNALEMLAFGVVAWLGLSFDSTVRAQDRPRPPAVDVQPRPMDLIKSGTVIGEGAPPGWTDLILVATPRLGAGDVEDVSKTTASYSRMFLFAILAKTKGDARDGFLLEKVAIGSAVKVEGKDVVVDPENTFGADLGWIGGKVLAENVRILKEDFRQVARTATMIVFDAETFVLREGKHRPMTLRHAILASPTTGQVSTFVWLLGSDGSGGYSLADKGLRKLPPNFREDRVLSVDGQRFTLGMPGAGAFALARLPQGTALGFSEALKAVAATKRFGAETVRKLEAELAARYAPVADPSNRSAPDRH